MSPQSPRHLELIRPIRVQGYDIDFAGVVSNIVYVRWLEDMRLAMLDEYCPLDGLIAEGLSPILAHTQVDYRRPIRLLDQVTCRMWMTGVGRVKWSLAAEFLVNGEIAAEASQSGGFVRLSDSRPVPMPELLASAWREATASIG
ncbi:MAG TPA: thioesterase family protein [Armatimonadota bacterium]|jgi:acyl-CoA thioester hydrolase